MRCVFACKQAPTCVTGAPRLRSGTCWCTLTNSYSSACQHFFEISRMLSHTRANGPRQRMGTIRKIRWPKSATLKTSVSVHGPPSAARW